MQLPLRLDAKARQSLQLQLFEQVRRLIAEGRLRPGARMPASRVLAIDLGVSRNTVALAYERLAAEGYIEMRSPIGAFVANNVIPDSPPSVGGRATGADDTPPPCRRRVVFDGQPHTVVPDGGSPLEYDFWVGRTDARLFPVKAWEQASHQSLREQRTSMSGYCDPMGLRDLRRSIAEYVGVARGIRARSDQILITNGIQQGLDVLARLFITRGTAVAVENPCYSGAANLFRSHGARLAAAEVDGAGVVPGRLPRDAAFAYLTPSHQYPTGATLPLDRRERVLEWAARTQAYVVEDDYDSDFYYDRAPLPSLKGMDEHDQVIYLGTFSKSLAAGLRIGYMVLPRHLVGAASAVKVLLDNSSPWLPQKLLAEFMASGAFAHHLRRIRTIYRDRRDRLLQALARHFDAVDIRGAQGGMHVMWRLPERFPDVGVLESAARRRGVGIHGLESCNVFLAGSGSPYTRSLLLGYAALAEDEIEDAVARMGAAFAGEGMRATRLPPRAAASGSRRRAAAD